MGFSIRTGHIPRLSTYKSALNHYESIKPIRGNYNNIRPIGSRRMQTQTIHQLPNGDVACKLYGTDCVIYHVDESMTIDFGHYRTVSTADFISRVTPSNIWAYSNGYVRVSDYGFLLAPRGGLKLCPNGRPMNPVQEYRTLVDKKKSAAARVKVRPFLQWIKAVKALGGEFVVTPNGLRVHALLQENIEDTYAHVASYYLGWDNELVKDRFYSDLYSHENCFIEVPVTLGTMRESTNWEGYSNANQ